MQRYIALAAAAVLIAGGVYYVTSQQPGQSVGPGAGAAIAAEGTEVDTSGIVEMTLGSADAPVTVIEYASYTCPHCATFHAGPFNQLKEDYINTGQVQFIYREVYFDRPGLWASMVARCGGEMRFFGITDLIYEQQRQWLSSGDPVQIADALRGIGRAAGMSNDEVNACLNDADKAQSLVSWYEANAAEHGINSTPSFVINGRRYGNMSYGEFSATIDGLLN